MSKLDQLIKKLCPNGVKYKNIDEVCLVFTGGEAPPDSIKGKHPIEDYIYPFLNQIWKI